MTNLLLFFLLAFLAWLLWGCWRQPFGDAPLTECGHCASHGWCYRACCTTREYASGQPSPGGPCRECQKGQP